MSAARAVPGTVFVSRYDPEYAVRAERVLAGDGFSVETLDSLREIRERVGSGDRIVLIVLTGGLAESSTRDFLRALQDASVPAATVALADRAEPQQVEKLHRAGVDVVLEKPFDPDELSLVARRLLLREQLVHETHIIGSSPAIQEVLERVAQYAPVNSTVLIEGESGTGKELIARAIHDLSPRGGKPFIAVNCAALTETLLESELFGHEKGAFTGATGLRKGRFELADGGTLFLDEVGEMPASTQVKLLRVLEEREFMRVGGSSPIHVDVRVLAATNKDLGAAVEAGEFRRDLFYRLNVLHVRMPPLRERREDIPLLVHHFIQEFCRENDRRFVGIEDDAMRIVQNYDWPGNVRELRNFVESMLVLTPRAKIRPRDLPREIFDRANPARLLPVALDATGEPQESRRVEALLGYFYREIKGELDAMRRDTAEMRDILESGVPGVRWLRAVEVEPEESGGEVAPVVASSTGRADSGDNEGEERPDAGFAAGMTLEELERMAIARTLEAVGGNRRRAAEMLGIGERTLYRKLKAYDLS